jgi:AcrR family transcriptional regulator
VVAGKKLNTSLPGLIELAKKVCYIYFRLIKSIQVETGISTETGTGMNEKFFDLKKEKQDRMINAALKVFAGNGYGHASTDDIVREAGISKGLLFHYFVNKIGLYTFVYDYSVKYLMLELSTGIDKKETDYFELLRQLRTAELQVMRNYPYMIQFLHAGQKENVSEALIATEDKRSILPNQYQQILRRADLSKFKSEADVEKLTKIIDLVTDGMMTEQMENDTFQPEHFLEEVEQYLTMLKKLSYQEVSA